MSLKYGIPRPNTSTSVASQKRLFPNLMGISNSPTGSFSRDMPKSVGSSWTAKTLETEGRSQQILDSGPVSFSRSPEESSIIRNKDYDEQQILLDLALDDGPVSFTRSPQESSVKQDYDEQQILVDLALDDGPVSFTRSPEESSVKQDYDEQQILVDLASDDLSILDKPGYKKQQIIFL